VFSCSAWTFSSAKKREGRNFFCLNLLDYSFEVATSYNTVKAGPPILEESYSTTTLEKKNQKG
jgi:hypothetical protein